MYVEYKLCIYTMLLMRDFFKKIKSLTFALFKHKNLLQDVCLVAPQISQIEPQQIGDLPSGELT